MKKIFAEPEFEIIDFLEEDVIITSGEGSSSVEPEDYGENGGVIEVD